ncbi:GNAT family N-acetyltransferase [Cohaesibacter haloalkalitolerans]|uniref:GNAT family N-acetyltransferase n=1 Tax=Cohaesibacter haloalkalitolerans TaxID=1162980 RepID=UPI000E64C432|nr:GNAT family N-acetyltransferase [Cohaesibacter haloalkalitolerans]
MTREPAAPQFEFARLTDLPHMVDACAVLNEAEWGDGSDESLEMRRAGFRRLAFAADNEDAILCLAENGELAGLCILIENDFPDFPDLGPWLASLIVAPAYRGQGLARRLVAETENLAREFGEEGLFVHSRSPELFRALGYQDGDEHLAGDARFYIQGKEI